MVGSGYIDVTGVGVVDRSQFEAAIERLVASHSLHGSESLCKLLRYLAKQAVEHPGVQVKEYQIATEVFGRQANFDPQLDSMVRVQAGRLRAKLTEYYGTEGASDTYMVELPKGSYAVVFHERSRPAQPNAGTIETREVASKAREKGENHWLVPILSAALLAALALIGWLTLGRKGVGPIVSASANAAAAPYRTFWNGFVTVQEEPWVIFSNAAFVGRPDTGMRYYDAAKDGKAPILDHYTGVGEVLAVHNLDQVFATLHQTLRVKRGSLFSLDDAKNNDLIFIGSPSENLTLLDVPGTKEFVFRRVNEGPRAGNMEIVNVHPGQGESSTYLATAANVPLTEDYAVVALVRGLNPEHSELILAGTTTIGTQAAVEFVTRENYLNNLLERMKVRKPSELKPFEAVIQVKVARGVPVESSLVALRVLDK
ncbi:MAG TPA: hypothetical protein VGF61_04885 [Candidatus Acidoferrum sp.]